MTSLAILNTNNFSNKSGCIVIVSPLPSHKSECFFSIPEWFIKVVIIYHWNTLRSSFYRKLQYTVRNFCIKLALHSKKSLLMVKLRSFQNASIEIKQISFVYQQNCFAVKKHICKMRNENSFTDKRSILTLKRNPLSIKGLHLYASRQSAPAHQ